MNEKLLILFERSKMSAYQLAQETGITQATLSRWRSQETKLSIDNIEKVATALGYELTLKKVKR